MRQIVTTATGGIEVLKVQEKPDPQPAAGEVVIRVRAAGLNFADILSRQGLYPDSPPKPCVMGYEVSGVIEAVGADVNQSFVGKSVAALTRFGGQSDLIAVKANQVFDKPSGLTFEQAAAIPVNYLTAYALLVVMGSLHEGESLLIHNAGGGVGLAALDIAKKIDVTTYGTASPSKHKFLKRARVGPSDRLSQPGLAAGVAATHRWSWRRSDHRSDWWRALEEELCVVEKYWTAGHVWSFNCFR